MTWGQEISEPRIHIPEAFSLFPRLIAAFSSESFLEFKILSIGLTFPGAWPR
jgi:hypothetical protein